MSSRTLLIIACMIFISAHAVAQHAGNIHHRHGSNSVLVKPVFPEGEDNMHTFINRNLRYPDAAKEAGNEGRVMLHFMVDEHGLVNRTTVIKSSGFTSLDTEALRCIRSMPAWIPGHYGKRAVPMFFTMPVIFRLE